MTIEYLKRAGKTPQTETESARSVAAEIISQIELRGETAVRDTAHEARPVVGRYLGIS